MLLLLVLLRAHDISVVCLPLLRVREDGIALADLGEAGRGVGILTVHVWVSFFGEDVELALEIGLGRVDGELKDFIVVQRGVTGRLLVLEGLGELTATLPSVRNPSWGRGESKARMGDVRKS